jgi:PrcB C-terminal
MRMPLLLLALALGCATAKPPSFRVAANGAQCAVQERQALVARDPESYRAMFARLIGNDTPPAIDFATQTAVFLFAGERPTGGYAIDVQSVARDGDALVVTATVAGPKPRGIVSQVITYPWAVVAVDAKAETVRWP